MHKALQPRQPTNATTPPPTKAPWCKPVLVELPIRSTESGQVNIPEGGFDGEPFGNLS